MKYYNTQKGHEETDNHLWRSKYRFEDDDTESPSKNYPIIPLSKELESKLPSGTTIRIACSAAQLTKWKLQWIYHIKRTTLEDIATSPEIDINWMCVAAKMVRRICKFVN